MKRLFACVGVLAGLALSSVQAAPPPSVDGGRSRSWLNHIEIVGHGPERATYYYTNVVLTGTRVPVVIRKYKGEMRIVSGGLLQGVSYNIGEFGSPASSNVGGILRADPAIQ